MYMVFFDHGEAALTTRAHEIIRQFRSNLSIYDQQRIDLLASTDTSETRDRGLSRRRGEAVAVALREEGLPGDATITIVPAGHGRLVPTPENTPEPQNRNVILIFRGGRQARPTSRQSECREWLATHPCGPGVGPEQAAACSRVRQVVEEFRS